MNKRSGLLILISILCFGSGLLRAAETEVSPWSVSAGLSALDFGYTEYSESGHVLDEENGWLKGFKTRLEHTWRESAYFASIEALYLSGTVQYDGRTQIGTPVEARTDESIIDLLTLAGFRNCSLLDRCIRLYAGLGYHYWKRLIHSAYTKTSSPQPVAGILEYYNWTYATMGIRVPVLKQTQDEGLELDFRLNYMLQAQMEINFLGYREYDNAKFDLGEDWGIYLGVAYRTSLAKGYIILIEPYYEQWDIKKSNSVEVTRSGAPTGVRFSEPASETRNYGINFSVQMVF